MEILTKQKENSNKNVFEIKKKKNNLEGKSRSIHFPYKNVNDEISMNTDRNYRKKILR